MRQATLDKQWAEIPLTVEEFSYSAAQAQNVPLTVAAQTGGLELIGSIVATIPAGTTGLVQLGSLVIPIPAGVTTIAPVRRLLNTSDTRSVTFTGTATGPCSLWLTGQQLPTYGVLAH
jgi:hypothetical protein